MNDKDFNNLLQAAKEFKQLRDGKIKPGRIYDHSINVKSIRKKFKMSQAEFADFIKVSLKTVINWEHGTTPTGAARSLLKVAQKQPKAVFNALHA